MSLFMEERETRRGESVGGILTKVQNDLKHLKERLLAQTRSGEVSSLDYSVLEDAIARTERGIKLHADGVVQLANNQVTLLPVHQAQFSPHHVETTHHPKQSAQYKTRGMSSLSLSPGQEVQLRLMGRLLNQPTHPTTRQLLSNTYGVDAPHHHPRRRQGTLVHGRRAAGNTVGPLTRLPQTHRRDALLTPPPIATSDAQKGLLSLLERGLIPRAAEIVMHPPPVQPSPAMLHSYSCLHDKAPPADCTESGAAMVGIKFDPIVIPTLDDHKKPVLSASHTKPRQVQHTAILKHPPPIMDKPLVLPPVETKQEADRPDSSPAKVDCYILTVRHGSIVENGEFVLFKQSAGSKWTIVMEIIQQVESVGKRYAIPIIFLHSQRTLQLAEEYVLEPQPSKWEILRCVHNRSDVEHLLRLPGRRFKGKNGLHAAAALIQATVRMYRQRCRYLDYRRKHWASRIIAMAWLLYVKARNVRQLLKTVREEHITNYRSRLKSLGSRWMDVQQNHRVVIHLPSKGYQDYIRRGEKQFNLQQSLQMVRVSDVIDPMVEVIYISPMVVTEEIAHYYKRLLAMGTGDDRVWERVHIITPQHIHSFKYRNLSLAALLKYSPRTIARIRRLIGGRTAYLVPEHTSREDLEVADMLGVPLIGAEPELVELYSTHSGRSKLFEAAGVTMPPAVEEVHSLEQVIDHLASLITAHLTVRRWLFKIDHYPRGRGFAYCDVADHLQCYQSIVRERERYGSKWNKQWARQSSRNRVISELYSVLAVHATPVDTTAFPSWSEYLKAFLKSGGTIEASPPSDSVTGISVDLLLGPDGSYSMLSTCDHIHSTPYSVWGGSMPQSSMEHTSLKAVIDSTAHAAQSRGIVGYLSVDLLTFIHPETLQQELWAVDIDFGPSYILVMAQTMSKIANVKFNPVIGQLLTAGEESRYAVVSCHLHHSNLSIVQHDVFFRMCKSHLIGYHPKTSTGVLFSLVEGSQRQRLGMMCLQPTLSHVLSYSSTTLSTIHQEITTPSIQGSSNLPVVYQQLEAVAALVAENEHELTNQTTA